MEDTEGEPSVQGGSCCTESQKQPSGWQATKLGRGAEGPWWAIPQPPEMSTPHLLTPDTEITVLFASKLHNTRRSYFYPFLSKTLLLRESAGVILPTRAKGPENLWFSSVHFSRLVVSDSLQPHESQHARPPCPSPSPGVHSDSRPSSQ